ncbi:MAG: hypothetical protein IPG78_07090 [Ignavibacteria bacterium]|nr:hypothetical protein [Ignavibacteria bacterium]
MINDASVNYEYADAASVFIDYYSYDPYNKDGRYKQNFIMKKYPDGWKIMKIENVKIEQWKNKFCYCYRYYYSIIWLWRK